MVYPENLKFPTITKRRFLRKRKEFIYKFFNILLTSDLVMGRFSSIEI